MASRVEKVNLSGIGFAEHGLKLRIVRESPTFAVVMFKQRMLTTKLLELLEKRTLLIYPLVNSSFRSSEVYGKFVFLVQTWLGFGFLLQEQQLTVEKMAKNSYPFAYCGSLYF